MTHVTPSLVGYVDKDDRSYTRKQAALIYKQKDPQDEIQLQRVVSTLEDITYPEDYKPPKAVNNHNLLNSLIRKHKIKVLADRIQQPYKTGIIHLERSVVMSELRLISKEAETEPFQGEIIGIQEGQAVVTADIKWDPNQWADDVEITFYGTGIPMLDFGDRIIIDNKLIEWEIPSYRTVPTFGKSDAAFINLFQNLITSGKYPDISGDVHIDAHEFTKRFKELANIQRDWYYGTGYYDKQIRRKLVVEQQAIKLSKPENRSYKDYRVYMDEVFPLDCVPMDFTSNDCNVWQEKWQSLGHDDSLYRLNFSADSGPWSLDNKKMAKVGVTLPQQDLLTQWLLECIEKDVPEDIWQWAGLSVLKAKAEIYMRNPPADKNYIRNYTVFNTFAMRGSNSFMKCFDIFPKVWDGEAIVMSGDVIFKGKMDTLLKAMIKRTIETQEPSYAVYSDNLTIVTLNADGVPHLVSVDGSKFESCIKKDLFTFEIRRMIDVFKEKGGTMSKQFETYLSELIPKWSTEYYSILENQQIKNNHMGSGTPGTFRWNSALMCRVVHHLKRHKFRMLEDFVQRQYDTTEYQWSSLATEAFTQAGTKLTIESVANLWNYDAEVITVDILGFDAVPLPRPNDDPIEKIFYAPQLSYQRFLKTMNFTKSRLLNSTNKEKKFVAEFVINMSRMRSAYVLYGWRDPYWSYLIQEYMAHLKNSMALYVQQVAKNHDQEDLQETIKIIHSEMKLIMTEIGVVDQFAGMLNAQTYEDLDLPTMYQTYELIIGENGRDAFIQNIIDEQRVRIINVVPLEAAAKFGVAEAVHAAQDKKVNQIWQGLITPNEAPEKVSIMQNLTNLFKNENKREYEKPKPLKRTHITGAVVDYSKNLVEKRTADIGVTLRLLQILKKSTSTLHVLVPVPVDYRETELPKEQVIKVVWDRLYKDIQHTFRIGDAEMKPIKTQLARVIAPYWLLPPHGMEVTTWEDFRTKKSITGKQYQLDYSGYTHDLYIRDMTTLDPRIDFGYYRRYGYSETDIQDKITSNEKIDTSELISGTIKVKGETIKPLRERKPPIDRTPLKRTISETALEPIANEGPDKKTKSKSVSFAPDVKKKERKKKPTAQYVEVGKTSTKTGTAEQKALDREERRRQRREKPKPVLAINKLDLSISDRNQRIDEWFLRAKGAHVLQSWKNFSRAYPDDYLREHFEEFVTNPLVFFEQLSLSDRPLKRQYPFYLALTSYMMDEAMKKRLEMKSQITSKALDSIRRSVYEGTYLEAT